MPRPIDADALREHWHISEKCEECHWNNRDCSKPPYYSLHDICEAIDEVPTIDAIPVEWLKQQFYDNSRSLWASMCRDVYTGWQKARRFDDASDRH